MQGNFEGAQQNFEQALEIQKKLYGSVHADVATSLNNLAALYGSQGKYYDAKELYKQAIAMRTTIFGLDHQTVAATYNNYGGLMYAIKEFDTARDLFESSLKIKIKVGEVCYYCAHFLLLDYSLFFWRIFCLFV